MSGRMQANGLVPYLLSATNTVIRMKLYKTILTQSQESGNPSTPAPDKERHSHPNPLKGDGTSRARLLKIIGPIKTTTQPPIFIAITVSIDGRTQSHFRATPSSKVSLSNS